MTRAHAQTPAGRCDDDDDSLTTAPFNLDESRRSVSGIVLHASSSPRAAPRAGSASAGRLRSVDSFTEYPSMSDVLLTSSKSSLPTSSDSAAAAMVASPRSRRSDSARGDSIDSWPSSAGEHAADPGSSAGGGDLPPRRSCSLGDVAVAHGGVPDSELQRQARRRLRDAGPPRRGGVSMDPDAGRRSTDAATSSSSAAEQRRRRRREGADQRAGRRHKSRSLTQMTTVDEERATTAAARLDAPAFAGSAV